MENGERRQRLRLVAQGDFRFRKQGETDPEVCNGQLVDGSVAGIRFITDAYLEKNTPLVIELDLDQLVEDVGDWRSFWKIEDNRVLTVVGSVMWCQECEDNSEGFEVGTRFTDKV